MRQFFAADCTLIAFGGGKTKNIYINSLKNKSDSLFQV